MTSYVYLVATCDTKGREARFVAERLARHGVATRLVDAGCLGESPVEVDVSREEVFRAAGTTHAALLEKDYRGTAVNAAARGVTQNQTPRVMVVAVVGGGSGVCRGTRWQRVGVGWGGAHRIEGRRARPGVKQESDNGIVPLDRRVHRGRSAALYRAKVGTPRSSV